jgi:hypothetical protein
MQPNAKSTTAQIEKKTRAVGRFIFTSIMLHSAQYRAYLAKSAVVASNRITCDKAIYQQKPALEQLESPIRQIFRLGHIRPS